MKRPACRRVFPICASVGLAVAACSSTKTWELNGATEDQFRTARATCQEEVGRELAQTRQSVPTVGPGNSSMALHQATVNNLSNALMILIYRDRNFEACMERYGFKAVGAAPK